MIELADAEEPDETGKNTHRGVLSSVSNSVSSKQSQCMVRVLHHYSKHISTGITPQVLLKRATTSSRAKDKEPVDVRQAKQLRDPEISVLIERYHELRSTRKLAAEFGMSRTTVQRLLAKRGVETSRSMVPGDVARAVEMYSQGLSSATIGAKLGFNNRTILRELRKVGVTIRPPVA